MVSLTENESTVLNFLIRHFNEHNNINQLGRKLDITHTGVHKILRKLEKSNIVQPTSIGNAIYYHINLKEELGRKFAELVLLQNNLNPYARVQADDLKRLKDKALACILFGSVLTGGRRARDIDVLIVVEKESAKGLRHTLKGIQELKPKRIHTIFQTREDIIRNIRKNDEIIIDIIKSGAILFGVDIIVDAIQHGTSQK